MNELSKRIINNCGVDDTITGDFNFTQSVAASLSNPVVWDACEVMHIMADLGYAIGFCRVM